MSQPGPRIVLSFTDEDHTWLRVSSITVPKFFEGHGEVPQSGDALRSVMSIITTWVDNGGPYVVPSAMSKAATSA